MRGTTLRPRGVVLFFGFFLGVGSLCGGEASRAAGPLTLYVASNGSDHWSGRLAAPNAAGNDGPLQTLTAARDRIRTARRAHPATAPTRVLVREGFYSLAEPFVLEAEDSGSKEAPMIYAAYPGEHPVISGGRKIRGWEKGEGNIWRVEIPEVREGKWAFRQLFVNGVRSQRARTPNFGFYRINGPKSKAVPFQIRYREDEFKPAWAALGDVEVVALFAWAEVRMPIRKVDEVEHVATLAGGAIASNPETDARYYIENAPDALDAPGEWYLDRKTGVLSYWPLQGEDMTRADVVAPALTRLVRFDGNPAAGKFVQHVVLRGLTFQDVDWDLGPNGYADVQAASEIGAAIKLTGARDCAIEACTITRVEGFAVDLGSGSQRNRVVRNNIYNIGAGAVKLGWGIEGLQPPFTEGGTRGLIPDKEAELNQENVVSDNHMYDLGIVFPSAVGVWIGQSIGSTVSHNHIHHLNYSGISVGWNWTYTPQMCHHNIIEYNHIHDISNMLSDLGAIYTLGIQPGTVLRNNLIHDISRFVYGGWGIYLDESSSHILVENNVVYSTAAEGFVQHYGYENVVRNNIFAFSKGDQVKLFRLEDHLSFSFEHNIVYGDEEFFGGDWTGSGAECQCREEMPIKKALPGDVSSFHPKQDCRHVRADNNIYYNAQGKDPSFDGEPLSKWQSRGLDAHSLVGDPRFVNAENYDFRPRPDSPALKKGFSPIDLRSIGIRRKP
jgi:parallel beta-helix repeat protein